MQINFLKEIVEEIAGKPATEIVDLLIGKKDVNEFLIAKKLNLTINQARNILYKLSEASLVTSNRKKDKRKGWFIYFWTLDVIKSLELLEKKASQELEQLNHQLKSRKSKRFYQCKTCELEVGEETALLNQFTCHECGQVYELSETDKVIKDLETKIIKAQKKLSLITEEKDKEQEQVNKKLKRKQARETTKENKEKKAKRKASKEARDKKNKEEKKKTTKKTIKKKTTKPEKKPTKTKKKKATTKK